MTSDEAIALEKKHGANNYEPIPIVAATGRGAVVVDPEGKEYLDFLSGICAVGQGHSHPKIVEALTEQAKRMALPSRAFYSDNFGTFARFATEIFQFDRILMMNTGGEAVETAMKLCRKWGYEKKKIPAKQAKIVVCEGNFHGRTIANISAAPTVDSENAFGPFLPNFVVIPYDDLTALETSLSDPTVAAFLVEPIQGEGGVVVPRDGYLKGAYDLCKKANVLFVADEVQTGLGRTGRLLACDHEFVTPDVLILGKALSGGIYPVSAILANEDVMSCFRPGDHGSTFGGNPLACAVARAALQVLIDENLGENAEKMGRIFREKLRSLPKPVAQIRGKGLLNAIVLETPIAKEICLLLKEKGLMAKNTRDKIIRFAPPLVITEQQMNQAIEIIKSALK